MRLAALVCAVGALFLGAAHAQTASAQRQGRQQATNITVAGWPAGTYACTVRWREKAWNAPAGTIGDLRTDTRVVPVEGRYVIPTQLDATVESVACTPDTPPGATETPEGCREWVRGPFNDIANQGVARQFREAHPGAQMLFRVALTPDEAGVPTMLAVTAQNATDMTLIEQYGDAIAAEITTVAQESRFTPQCAGARIMLPYTLR